MFLKDFAKELTRVNGRQAVLDHDILRSVVIDDLNIDSIALREAKTHSPLVIDSDTPLTLAITLESFQTIRRRRFEVFNLNRRIQLRQSHRSSTANLRGQASRATCRIEPLSLRIPEGLNHLSQHKRFVYSRQALLCSAI